MSTFNKVVRYSCLVYQVFRSEVFEQPLEKFSGYGLRQITLSLLKACLTLSVVLFVLLRIRFMRQVRRFLNLTNFVFEKRR